jgi:hypothetical protein
MTNELPAAEFAAKTWIFKVQALFFGGLGIFSLVLGPLFLFQVMLDAHGKPATDAGVALTIASIPFLCLFALATSNILLRRQPPIRLFHEGLVVNRIGSSTLDQFRFVPVLIRIAWLIVSLQGFKCQTLVIPWETFLDACVSGLPMDHTLTLSGNAYGWTNESNSQAVVITDAVAFAEVEFKTRLDEIAEAINNYHQDLDARSRLPSWRA